MKHVIKLLPVISLFYSFSFLYSQNESVTVKEYEKCNIADKNLKGAYLGDCKKGLAHGQGEFIYEGGNKIFEGRFKKGYMNGEGKLFNLIDGKKTIIKEGIWKKNKYVGKKKEKPYDVNTARVINIDRYNVRRLSEGNQVRINFYQNGNRNPVRNLDINVNNGNRVSGSFIETFENIIFPFECQITYSTQNKFKTMTIVARFEIVIKEPGDWKIDLFN